MSDSPAAVQASEVPARQKLSHYPPPFIEKVAGREKRILGDLFGLTNFGVNLTTLTPGKMSGLRHAHTLQDEFLYVLEGRPTLYTDHGPVVLAPGMCAGFKAGTGNGHHLINESDHPVVYLEIGDRTPGDSVIYPDDDLVVVRTPDGWGFSHKNGEPYEPTHL